VRHARHFASGTHQTLIQCRLFFGIELRSAKVGTREHDMVGVVPEAE
jgi:hypothetical protein